MKALLETWRWLNAKPIPARVGLLNTGELVLVDSTDRAQVLNARTTRVIRDVLDNDPDAERVTLPPPLFEGTLPRGGVQPCDTAAADADGDARRAVWTGGYSDPLRRPL